jgi:hypothetical protein
MLNRKGIICAFRFTAARSRLSYDHLNEIVCLHYWLKSDMNSDPSARELKRARVAAKFATLSLELEIVIMMMMIMRTRR